MCFPQLVSIFIQKSFMKLRFENAVVLIIYFDAKPTRIIEDKEKCCYRSG